MDVTTRKQSLNGLNNKMSNNPRTAGIAAFLRRYFAEHKRVSATNFVTAAKNVLSPKEAEEVFEYCTSIKPCLATSTKRMFVWTCKQDHFNDTAVGEMIDWLELSEKQDKRIKKSVQKEVQLVSDLQYNEETGDFEISEAPKIRSLGEILSDLEVIVHELDAMGMYLVADKHGYGIHKDFDPVI